MTRKEKLNIAEDWFAKQHWKPFAFQKQTWNAFLQGKNGLLNAPTGSGKTYALFVPILLKHLTQKDQPKKGLKVLWITPLRSLSQEIKLSCLRLSQDIHPSWTIETRTGDTSAADKARQKRAMPDMLITTPETLHLLLASKGYPKLLQHLDAIIIDEWHELLGSKRGVQVELALSRLKNVSKNLKIWGISATIGNLDQAMQVLIGPNSKQLENATLIKANLNKKITVKSVLPNKMEKFPWRGHLGLHLLSKIIPILQKSTSTLIFTNTRAQCELWFQALLAHHPDFAGEIAMHHGSIEKETRLWVESAIRANKLKVVVCTSSLDLGVDFAPVETIIQIGGPKGVARFIQRAGRSGHQPEKTSVIHFLPTHAIELIEASALQKAVLNTAVEERVPYIYSFDVLIQYLITLAISEGFKPKEILEEINQTFCYQNIQPAHWNWILNFITQGSQSITAYDEYHKVTIDENGLFKVKSRRVAMQHRMQIGTIVGDEVLRVKYLKGGSIGTIEEYFASMLQKGDVFTFAGKNLEFYAIREMTVLVKKSKSTKGKVVSWAGGRMSFSAQMSALLREELYHYHEDKNLSTELKALLPIFKRQEKESIVPKNNEFLIETFKTREGHHALFYPFEGRFVHEALASLIAYRTSLLNPISFSIAFNDYGFELLSDQEIDIQAMLDNNLFTSDHLKEDLQNSLNATEMARRAFRDIAVISGLVFTGYPGKHKKSKHLQSSAQLIFNVFKDYEPDNLLLQQAYWETFEHKLEEGRLRIALERIQKQEIIWKACKKPTPFSFPIMTDRLREKLTSEKLMDRIQKMTLALEK